MSNDEISGQESSGSARQPAAPNEPAGITTEKTLKGTRWKRIQLADCVSVQNSSQAKRHR